jgi:hypothetical protein
MPQPKPELSKRETLNFLHNAQLALLDRVADEDIPTIYEYSRLLKKTLLPSKLTPEVLASILVTVARTLIKGDN